MMTQPRLDLGLTTENTRKPEFSMRCVALCLGPGSLR
ncbi:hypothetical protein OKW43_005876 [Paraburkholderia sp. WC7.3g]